jgi:hypothetical protein
MIIAPPSILSGRIRVMTRSQEGSDDSIPAGELRCVVLMPPGTSVPAMLLTGLSRRGASVTVVTQGPRVMVELLAQPTASVIAVEPQQQPRLEELAAAVHRYYPKTAVWQFRVSKGQPQLSPYIGDSPGRMAAEDPAVAAATELKRGRRPPAVAQDEGPLITGEELAMLLGPGPGEQGGATGRERLD